jgi:hypothetical protein
MSSSDAAICVGCGGELPQLIRSGYCRCQNCVSTGRPYSLQLARRIHASRQARAPGLHDFDPAGRAAA